MAGRGSPMRLGALALVFGLAIVGCGAAPSPSPSPVPTGASSPGTTHGTAAIPSPPGVGTAAPSGVCSLPPLRFQVAQLLLVPVPGTEPNASSLEIVRQGVGGILLFKSNIESAAQIRALIAALQAAADVPLVVAVDEEPGRVARLAQAGVLPETPTARALGTKPAAQVRATGKKIGTGLASLGITTDLAPVLDVTGAEADSVIGDRSFGSSPTAVSRASVAFLQGLQEAGVTGVAKHFPGHGESVTDSHTDLPVVESSISQLRKRALPPFKAAIKAGVPAVMVGHLLVRAVDPYLPATLSSKVIGGLLRGELKLPGWSLPTRWTWAPSHRGGTCPWRWRRRSARASTWPSCPVTRASSR